MGDCQSKLIEYRNEIHSLWDEIQGSCATLEDGEFEGFSVVPKHGLKKIINLSEKAVNKARECEVPTEPIREDLEEVKNKIWRAEETRFPYSGFLLNDNQKTELVIKDLNSLANSVHESAMESVNSEGSVANCKITQDRKYINDGELAYCQGIRGYKSAYLEPEKIDHSLGMHSVELFIEEA